MGLTGRHNPDLVHPYIPRGLVLEEVPQSIYNWYDKILNNIAVYGEDDKLFEETFAQDYSSLPREGHHDEIIHGLPQGIDGIKDSVQWFSKAMSDVKGKLPFFMKILSLFLARFLVLSKEPAMLNSEDVLKMRSSFSLAFLLTNWRVRGSKPCFWKPTPFVMEKSNIHTVLKIGAPLYNKCFMDIPLLILALTEALLIFKQNLFGRSEHENSCSFVILMIFCKTFYFYIDHDKLMHLAGGSPRSPLETKTKFFLNE